MPVGMFGRPQIDLCMPHTWWPFSASHHDVGKQAKWLVCTYGGLKALPSESNVVDPAAGDQRSDAYIRQHQNWTASHTWQTVAG